MLAGGGPPVAGEETVTSSWHPRPTEGCRERRGEAEEGAWGGRWVCAVVLLSRLAPVSHWGGMKGYSLETHRERLSWKARVPSQIVSFTAK